ncbi:hypothetical protein CDD83_2167 [Cordyceps sp. RAO-2017]|nr:hypothetical protein CDD83_2167 [Cordyceps sp. RAO-2017]
MQSEGPVSDGWNARGSFDLRLPEQTGAVVIAGRDGFEAAQTVDSSAPAAHSPSLTLFPCLLLWPGAEAERGSEKRDDGCSIHPLLPSTSGPRSALDKSGRTKRTGRG